MTCAYCRRTIVVAPGLVCAKVPEEGRTGAVQLLLRLYRFGAHPRPHSSPHPHPHSSPHPRSSSYPLPSSARIGAALRWQRRC